MIGRFHKNRIIDSFLKLLVLSAVVHTVIVVSYALYSGKLSMINYFSMLDLGLLLPWLMEMPLSGLLSIVVLVLAYISLYSLHSGKQ